MRLETTAIPDWCSPTGGTARAAASRSAASRERSIPEGLQLLANICLRPVGLTPALHRRFERLERERHRLIAASIALGKSLIISFPHARPAYPRNRKATKYRVPSKCLETELYVRMRRLPSTFHRLCRPCRGGRPFFDSRCPRVRGSHALSIPRLPWRPHHVSSCPTSAAVTRRRPGMTRSAASIPRAQHESMANAIRALAMDAVEKAKSGHPGLPMGAADIATVLFTQFLKFDPPTELARPRPLRAVGRPRLDAALCAALSHRLPRMTIEEIKRFRQLGSLTPGHPEYGHTPGIETTTGPLGQGLANAVGMAIAERHLAARFGDELVDHHTYVLASDGDLMEGISQEAIALAGHLRLNKLIVLSTTMAFRSTAPLARRFGRPDEAIRGRGLGCDAYRRA